MTTIPTSEVPLCGMSIARIDTESLLDLMFSALERREGGWIVTANLAFLRRAATDAQLRALYNAADIRVADGMPVVWATKLAGRAVPEQIAGSSLIWDIARRACAEGRSIHLLGGEPGAAEGAATRLRSQWPALRMTTMSPSVTCPPTQLQLEDLASKLLEFGPDIVLVALGSPKQEHVIRGLRGHLPNAWMIGVGMGLSFVAGQKARAPRWMRRVGLEWVHRLVQEPRRLAARYLLHDAPFALRLFADAAQMRLRGDAQPPQNRPGAQRNNSTEDRAS